MPPNKSVRAQQKSPLADAADKGAASQCCETLRASAASSLPAAGQICGLESTVLLHFFIEAEPALRRDGEAQRHAAARRRKGNGIKRVLVCFRSKARFYHHARSRPDASACFSASHLLTR